MALGRDDVGLMDCYSIHFISIVLVRIKTFFMAIAFQ